MAAEPMTKVIEYLRDVAARQEKGSLTDKNLLDCFVDERDTSAFTILVRRHAPLVWGVCRRVLSNHHDAEDAFQATFLVLARRAALIASREQLASWLYGVAYRTAIKARSGIGKRHARERQVPIMPEPKAYCQASSDDWLSVLDQELNRLPEKYRTAIVICDLEGKTRKEAARLLGLPEGTMASRLARARAMLAKRLARHGMAITGSSLATAMSAHAATVCVPVSVVWTTIKAATLLAAGQAAAGAISAKVAALTESMVKAMFISRLTTTIATLAAVIVVTALGGGTAWYVAAGQASDVASGTSRVSTEIPLPPARDHREIGRVEELQKKDEKTANAQEVELNAIWDAHLWNAALFDEKYRGKRLLTSGKVSHVNGLSHYSGTSFNPMRDLSTDDANYFLVLHNQDGSFALNCVFPESDRKLLAELVKGQKMTVEGVCRVRTVAFKSATGTATAERDLYFLLDCKIIKIEK